ncbi:hypothetical protein ACFYUK_45240 [Nonomuraea wenchangensis]
MTGEQPGERLDVLVSIALWRPGRPRTPAPLTPQCVPRMLPPRRRAPEAGGAHGVAGQ